MKQNTVGQIATLSLSLGGHIGFAIVNYRVRIYHTREELSSYCECFESNQLPSALPHAPLMQEDYLIDSVIQHQYHVVL